jgi:uncharacterized protein YndB with AHSA1/START domain
VLKILGIIVFGFVAILVLAAFRSNTIEIQRSRTIPAAPEKIFALINDFHNWKLWAPQDREDPELKRTFSGPESGIGAESGWSGSGNSGQGKMVIVESEPSRRVSVKVDFVKPFEAHNLNQFTLAPAGTSTNVTWQMLGTNPYFMKVMGLFVNLDKLMGKHFEAGLENLATACQADGQHSGS